jgi:anthranilate synthase component I
MYFPTVDEALELSKSYNLIPIRMVCLADQETPISIYQRLRCDGSFLLESAEEGARLGRYSFIGLNPWLNLKAKEGITTLSYRTGEMEEIPGNPLDTLRSLLKGFKSPLYPDLPSFSGGAVGYFGFDILQFVEKLPSPKANDLEMADLQWLFMDQVIVYDHFRHELQVIGHLFVHEGDTKDILVKKYDQICVEIKKLAKLALEKGVKQDFNTFMLSTSAVSQEVESNLTQAEFEGMVEKAKEYILSGDIFQVVLSQRFVLNNPPDPFRVYRVLRQINPSPYMYYLQFSKDETIVGSSPEMLVKVEDGKVETRPIAGTRKKGKTQKENDWLKEDLLSDEKECAEHYMLVDLGRNDIGRVAEYGSVKMEQLMEVELFSHVMHIVSHVTGKLQAGKDSFDALLACFPAGTVSGAPKLRALEIIAEMEPHARNAYAGAIGYFSFSGNMDTCITIRTVVFKQGKAYVQAGAGIVADSVPEKEYEETKNKAMALIQAIQLAHIAEEDEEDEENVSKAAK